MTIFLLEDDSGVSELIQLRLQACGYETISTQFAGEALAWLETHFPDLMLVDYSLPDMNGKEFIESLAQKRSPLPAFIVATGRSDVRIAVEMMKLGARDYIVKDLDFLEILPELIRKVFKELDNEKRLKHAEQALRENEEKFRALYNNAPLSYQSLDTNGCFIDVNPAWLSTLGYERHEVIGTSFAGFLHPDWKAHFEKNFPEFKRRGYVHDVQFKIRHKDGHYRDISFEGCIGYWPDGSFRQTYCVFQDITERKRAEDALRESEERFRQVYEHMAVGVARVSMDFQIEAANEAYCRMLGYREEELLGKHLKDITHPEWIEENLRKQSQLARGEIDHYRMEKRFVHKEGHAVDGILDANLVRNVEGKALYFLGSVLDISDRKKTGQALRESEEKYRTLFENMVQGAFYQRADGVLIDCNPAVLEMFGLTRDQFLGKTSMDPRWEVICEDGSELPGEQHPSMEALRTGKAVHDAILGVYNLQKEDYVWMSINAIPQFRAGESSPYQVFVTLHDITERKRADDALRESEEKYRTLFEYLPIPVFTKDCEGGYTSSNTENQKYWTIDPLGRTDAELLDEKIARGLRETDLRVMESGQALSVEEVFTETPFGERQMLSRKVPLRNAGGQIVGILGASLDITDRKRAEEKIKTALKEKEVLLRELFHRTKNNMQVISSMLALQSQYIKDHETLHIFKDMEHRIQSMALIHQKLYQAQNLSQIDLGEYIHDLTALLSRSYTTSQRVAFEIDVEEVFVLIDVAIPCGLIVNELLTNALKYAFSEGQDGLIRVNVQRVETGDIDLCISDNGVGAPEDFDFRNTKTLGLQTVFALAERQLHGTIHFTVSDGLTCRFRFRDNLYKERV